MMDFYHEGRQKLIDIIFPDWADPIYTCTLIMLLILLSTRKHFKKWNDLQEHQRRYLKALIFATTITVIASILQLFSLI